MLKMSQLIRSTLLILINAAHDGLRFLRKMACSHSALAAENLFLRKQLAFYQEHKIRPRRLSNAARFSLLLWSRLFDWRAALAIVKPDTFLRWRREAYKRFWQWRSRAGRPRLPENIRRLIAVQRQELSYVPIAIFEIQRLSRARHLEIKLRGYQSPKPISEPSRVDG